MSLFVRFAPSRRMLPLAVLLLFASSSAGWAASGGPDTYGYTWWDSAEPGITYAWEEIGVGGTEITIDGDDVNLGFQPLSFSMPYYGGLYNQVSACSNGWVSLVDGTSATYNNVVLPNAGIPMGIIAGFWDDLRLTVGTSRVFFQDLGDHAVVEWKGAHDLGDITALNSFEIILYADGRIAVQYLQLLGDRTSCTVGIESPDETDGLTAWFDLPAGVPASNYRVEFRPPVPLPLDLDCTSAQPIACGDRSNGNLAAGIANQDRYRCSLGDYSGRELVYRLDLAAPTQTRIILDTVSGNPDLFIVVGCDPNTCQGVPGDSTTRLLAAGTYYLVVDCAPGSEGAFRLRVDCQPIASGLDCAAAPAIPCGGTVNGDLSSSPSLQDTYWCTNLELSGPEDVYLLDLPSPVDILFTLTSTAGTPQLLLLSDCDPNNCQVLTSGTTLTLAAGRYAVVVESDLMSPGPYSLTTTCLADSFTFCGTGLYESRPWGAGNGAWLVNGWLYHPGDTHSFALRVDGATTYEDAAGGCTGFSSFSSGVIPLTGPGFVFWQAPEGEIGMTLSETSAGGCCGLLARLDMTNTDVIPHSYEFRVYHDTAFGTGAGVGMGDCNSAGTIDGGPIEVNGTRYTAEVDLKAIGADTCAGQVQMFSADEPAVVRSSYQMLPPNLPSVMEFLDWNDGGAPCTTWSSMVSGTSVGNCFEDSSLLLIWRFPDTAGTLAPGETSTAYYRIGWRCAFGCGGCEFPTLSTANSTVSACNEGVRLSWANGNFPGTGRGAYNVYRSTLSFADALLQLPIVTGLANPSYVDTTAVPGTTYYYVVQAESLDYPGCGTGPLVNGSTAELNIGPVLTNPDLTPPATNVGATLRATGKTASTVDFNWLAAPAPAAGEFYVILRSDNRPEPAYFSRYTTTSNRTWTDADAPPRYSPRHVWFYDVRLADECGNTTPD